MFPLTGFKSFCALVIAVVQFLGAVLFNIAITPRGQELDLSRFEMTWEDEFEGEALNREKWNDAFHLSDVTLVQRGGYWNSKMVSVSDGALRITSDYLEEGLDGGPAGFYAGGVDSQYKGEQIYGYFEVRCKLPKGPGKWSAFWLTSHDGPENGDDLEIDVMESPNYTKPGRDRNTIVHNIHRYYNYEYAGGKKIAKVLVKDDPYEEFHTYGAEWNEKEIIFYVDGVESVRRDTKDLPVKKLYVNLTIETGGEDGIPGESWVGAPIERDEHLPSQFVVDYVRMYQYK